MVSVVNGGSAQCVSSLLGFKLEFGVVTSLRIHEHQHPTFSLLLSNELSSLQQARSDFTVLPNVGNTSGIWQRRIKTRHLCP
jgi:hypothetical protein